MHNRIKLSKSEFNFRVNYLKEILDLNNWDVEQIQEYFYFKSSIRGSFYRLNIGYLNNPFRCYIWLFIYYGPVEYIFKDFFTGPDNLKEGPYIRRTYSISKEETNIDLPIDLKNNSFASREVFEFCLPIIKVLWQETKMIGKRFEALETLYYYAIEQRNQGNNVMSYAQILILSKLISEEKFENEIKFISPFNYAIKQNEKSKEISDSTIKLIKFLRTFDSTSYLKESPWESVSYESNHEVIIEPDSIYLDCTCIIALSTDYSGGDLTPLAKLFGGSKLERSQEFQLGNVAILEEYDSLDLHILQLAPTTIIFIQNPALLTSFREELVTSGQCLTLITELQTTDSAMISYNDQGVSVMSYTKKNGKLFEKSGDFTLQSDKLDTVAIIEELFERVTKRRHQDLRSDETGYTYTLITKE